jgi:ubiquinone biosynthesis protein
VKRFAVQVALDTVAVVLTLAIFTFVRIQITAGDGSLVTVPVAKISGSILSYVAIGAILVLADTFVRPIVIALTGRLLLWSMGLFLLVLNAVIFALAAWLSPVDWVVANPELLWVFLVATLYTILQTIGSSILGLNRPIVDETGRGQLIWRILDALPTPRRNAILENLRLQQVYDTIARYGLDIAVGGTALRGVWDRTARLINASADPIEGMSNPSKVRVMLQELGPTWVKLGQMASTRSEALPPDWVEELAKLQEDVAPFPWELAREQIIAELKHPPEELYASIDHEPLAAASTAQVHAATLDDGSRVIVKVQRPEIVAKTKADLGVMTEIAGIAEKRFAYARAIDASGFVEEFADGVIRELDYRNEAYYAIRMAENMATIENVHIPVIHRHLSTTRILTEERIGGVRLNDLEAIDAAGLDREEIARTFIRALIKQIIIDGFFHADPHPGNIRVDLANGVITFLDFGLVGELTTEERVDLADLVWAVRSKDLAGVSDVALRLCIKTDTFDEAEYRLAMDRALRQHWIYGTSSDFSTAMSAILSTFYANGLRPKSSLTLAVKAIMQADGVARMLAPSYSLTDIAMAEIQSMLAQEFTVDRVIELVRGQVMGAGRQAMRNIPSLQTATLSWIEQYKKGKFIVEVDTGDLTQQIGRIGRFGDRLAVALVLAGQLIATAIVSVLLTQVDYSDFAWLPVVGIVLFAAILAVSLFVLWHMFRSVMAPNEDPKRR